MPMPDDTTRELLQSGPRLPPEWSGAPTVSPRTPPKPRERTHRPRPRPAPDEEPTIAHRPEVTEARTQVLLQQPIVLDQRWSQTAHESALLIGAAAVAATLLVCVGITIGALLVSL
jgi:hypothetical protein